VTEAPLSDKPEAQPAVAKLDPEALALRTQPERAIRFKRGAIIGIAAIALTSVVVTTWIALQPASIELAAQRELGADLSANASLETLASLPSNYGDVPKLGPPLPGDLGRPILRHQQRAMATETGSLQRPAIDQSIGEQRDRLEA